MNKSKPFNLFRSPEAHKDNKFCRACNKELNEEDKKQDQHIYPKWFYQLLKRNKNGLYEFVLVDIIENTEQIHHLRSLSGNFWCKNCETISGQLDSAAKNILFNSPTSKLNPGQKQFEKVNELDEDDSTTLHRWLFSLFLRLFLNEITNSSFLSKLDIFIKNMNGESCHPLWVALDSGKRMDFVYPATIYLDKNSQTGEFLGTYGLQIGSLHVTMITDPNLKITGKEMLYPGCKTKIKTIDNANHVSNFELYREIEEYNSHVTPALILVNKTKKRKDNF